MNPDDDLRAVLRRAGAAADSAIDLVDTALALAALERRTRLGWYRSHLARLVDEVGEAARGVGAGVEGPAEVLRAVLFDRYGYHGDQVTYEDLQNANLMRVIDRRKGLPVALGILYIHIARAQGWECAGLNFPGHFLIRLDRDGERAILDPFDGGQMRGPAELRGLLKTFMGQDEELSPEHYAPVGNRAVLLRLQNNLKTRHATEGRFEAAVRVLDTMLTLAPREAHLWREAGLMRARLGQYDAAIEALDRFIANADGDRVRHEAATLVQQLKARLN
ncbi:MAG: tetratricopeptide repeat protein [Inquilinus sp.]|nr:tetratricopeptide repeat protein [Inquilinus sp.]